MNGNHHKDNVTLTKKMRLLKFVRDNPEGVRFIDMQRFACTMSGFDFEKKELQRVWTGSEVKEQMRRVYRGWWCDYLCDTLDRKGIISQYLKKEGKLYFLNEVGKEVANLYKD